MIHAKPRTSQDISITSVYNLDKDRLNFTDAALQSSNDVQDRNGGQSPQDDARQQGHIAEE